MRKAQMDTLMAAMLESHDSVSDLNFSVDRPLQVHSNGELAPVSVTPSRWSCSRGPAIHRTS